MAHQAHNIPWNSIASGLQYVYQAHNARGRAPAPDPLDRKTDLVPLKKSGFEKQYVYFVKAFSKALHEFVDSERRKYSPASELRQFSDNEDVFDRDTINLFRKESLKHELPKMLLYLEKSGEAPDAALQPVTTEVDGDAVDVPPHIAAALPSWPEYIIDVESFSLNRRRGWVHDPKSGEPGHATTRLQTYRGQQPEHWGGYKMVSSVQERGDVATLCLQANNILPLLRLAKSPGQNLKQLWRINGYSQLFNRPSGLGTVLTLALDTYVILNLLYCKPELYTRPAEERGARDYRLCYSYRAIVANSTCEDDHDYWAIPHRAFWGTGRYFVPGVDNRRENPILKDGVEVDPLGDGHAKELQNYLRECWNAIVRCAMLANEWGVDAEVEPQLIRLFQRFGFLDERDCEKIWNSEEWIAAFGRSCP